MTRLSEMKQVAAQIAEQERHLTPEQKRELIEKVLRADPTKSDRQIARAVKVDNKTVGQKHVRKFLTFQSELTPKGVHRLRISAIALSVIALVKVIEDIKRKTLPRDMRKRFA